MDIVDDLRRDPDERDNQHIREARIMLYRTLHKAADEIEDLRIKKKIAVEWIKELLDFLEFIYKHPEFENSLKAYEWIMFQIEMIVAKYNEPVGEER